MLMDRISGVASSADGRWIAASNDDSEKTRTAVWDRTTGRVGRILQGFTQGFHVSEPALLLELPSREYIASVEDGATITNMPGNGDASTGHIYSWTSTGRISRWVPGRKRETRKLEDVPKLRAMRVSRDGTELAICHRDDRIRVWRWDEEACLEDFAIEHGELSAVVHLQFARENGEVWVVCGGTARAWNRATKSWSVEMATPTPGDSANAWVSPTGSGVLLTDWCSDTIFVHDVATKARVESLSPYKGVRVVLFSDDGRFAAVVQPRHVTVLDTSTWRPVFERPGWQAVFDRKQPRIAVGDVEGCVTVYDLESGAAAERYDLVAVLKEADSAAG